MSITANILEGCLVIGAVSITLLILLSVICLAKSIFQECWK